MGTRSNKKVEATIGTQHISTFRPANAHYKELNSRSDSRKTVLFLADIVKVKPLVVARDAAMAESSLLLSRNIAWTASSVAQRQKPANKFSRMQNKSLAYGFKLRRRSDWRAIFAFLRRPPSHIDPDIAEAW